jgi:hypothetical protein
MNSSQAAFIIQRNYRHHLNRNKKYKYCGECNALLYVDLTKSWYFICKPCLEYIDRIETQNRNYRSGKGPEPEYRICYCNDYFCNWNCGVLDCGCIDVCRKRSHKGSDW